MSILYLLLVWRAGLFAIAALIEGFTSFAPQFPYSDIYLLPSGLPRFVWGFANFDGVHYLTIAQNGYMAQFTQAFFPLYPMLIRYSGYILQDHINIISGLILSFVCFVAAFYYFRKLLSLDYKHSTVTWVLVFLLAFPTSFYFAALYSESLFFLLTILLFWFARKHNWWLAGFFGFLAALTRVNGILLFPILIVEWLMLEKKINSRSAFKKIITASPVSLLGKPVFYLIPLGLAIYMVYLKYAFNDPLYFWHAQEVFGAERSVGIVLPPQVLWRYVKILTTVEFFSYPFLTAFWELCAFIIGFVGLIMGHQKHTRLSYLLFGWGVLLLPTFTGTFSSLPRYILLIFPLFIVFGLIKSIKIRLMLVIFFISLQLLFLSHFLSGLWVA